MSDKKNIYVVWTNTDLTEGRGHQIPIGYTEARATALRIAKGRGVMGSDASVNVFEAIKHGGYWCAPVSISLPTTAEVKADTDRKLRESALAKAKALGLSDEDLSALGAKP